MTGDLTAPLGLVWFAAIGLAFFDGRRAWVGWAAVVALATTLAGTVAVAIDVARNGPQTVVAGGWPSTIGITLEADALGLTFALLSLAVLLVALAYEVLAGVTARGFPALVLAMATGLLGLCLTADLFNFYVFFEIAMVSAYVLTGYGDRPHQLRAATIFLTVNLLGSVLFLIAIAALYHLTGTLDMDQLAIRIPIVQTNSAILSATLIFVAFGIKLGLFPFHFWLAAVYTGTQPAVAAILSGALVNIGSYGLLRIGGGLLPRELEQGAPILLALGAASILYGGLQAISCGDPREVLAYSSIGQAGYILICLAIGGELGYAAAVLFAVTNAINKTLLFLVVPLRGPWVTAAVIVGAASVAGIPPATGFFGKAAVFRAAVADGNIAILTLLVAGGALSFIYMFQMVGRQDWGAGDGVGPNWSDSHLPATRVIAGSVAVVVIGLGVWPEPLLVLSEAAAAVLVARLP